MKKILSILTFVFLALGINAQVYSNVPPGVIIPAATPFTAYWNNTATDAATGLSLLGGSSGGGSASNVFMGGVITNNSTNAIFSPTGTNAINLQVTNLAIANQNGFGTNVNLVTGETLSTTNINILGGLGGSGGRPSGGIVFPNGDAIREFANGSGSGGEIGIAIGYSNSPPLYERYTSIIGGASNDVNAIGQSSIVTGASIFGGVNNLNNGNYSTVLGGHGNTITGSNSFAIGSLITLSGSDSAVLSDGKSAVSLTNSRVLELSFENGVAINTNSAGTNALEVFGNVDSISASATTGTYSTANLGTATAGSMNASDIASYGNMDAQSYTLAGVPINFSTFSNSVPTVVFCTNSTGWSSIGPSTNYFGQYVFNTARGVWTNIGNNSTLVPSKIYTNIPSQTAYGFPNASTIFSNSYYCMVTNFTGNFAVDISTNADWALHPPTTGNIWFKGNGIYGNWNINLYVFGMYQIFYNSSNYPVVSVSAFSTPSIYGNDSGGAGVINGLNIGTNLSPAQLEAAGVVTNRAVGTSLSDITVSNATYKEFAIQRAASSENAVQLDAFSGFRNFIPHNGPLIYYDNQGGASYTHPSVFTGASVSSLFGWKLPEPRSGGTPPLWSFDVWGDSSQWAAYRSWQTMPANLYLPAVAGSGSGLNDLGIDPRAIIAAEPLPPLVFTTYFGAATPKQGQTETTNYLYSIYTNSVYGWITNNSLPLWCHMDATTIFWQTNRDASGYLSINPQFFPDGTNIIDKMQAMGFKVRATLYTYPYPTNLFRTDYIGNAAIGTNCMPSITPNFAYQDVQKAYDFGLDGLRLADGQITGPGNTIQFSKKIAEAVQYPLVAGNGQMVAYSKANVRNLPLPLQTEYLYNRSAETPAGMLNNLNEISPDAVSSSDWYGGFSGASSETADEINYFRMQYVYFAAYTGPGHYCYIKPFIQDFNTNTTRLRLSMIAIGSHPLQIYAWTNNSMPQNYPVLTSQLTNNPVFVRIWQDKAVNRPWKVRDNGPTNNSVWSKELTDGSIALALLNDATTATNLTISMAAIGLQTNVSYSATEAWGGSFGNFSQNFTYSLGATNGALVLLTPIADASQLIGTVPDANLGSAALTNRANTFTANQTFNGTNIMTNTVVIGNVTNSPVGGQQANDVFGRMSIGARTSSRQTANTIDAELIVNWKQGDALYVTARQNTGGNIFNSAAGYYVDLNGGVYSPTNIIAAKGFSSLASNTLALASITFPASNVNWTNTTGRNIFVLLDNTAITGTVIKINGTQVSASLTGGVNTLPLQPGEYFSETYTVGTPSAVIKPE